MNETFLNGSYYYATNSLITINWAKVSGPSSFAIENTNALHTKLSQLEEGAYQFELTVSDVMGIYDKDTVIILVSKLPSVTTNANEIIYDNMQWIFPWVASIEIKNFNLLLPPGTPFEVFIQRDNDPQWVKVMPINNVNDPNIKYEYIIETRPDGAGMYTFGSLYVSYYGLDASDTPTVKITH